MQLLAHLHPPVCVIRTTNMLCTIVCDEKRPAYARLLPDTLQCSGHRTPVAHRTWTWYANNVIAYRRSNAIQNTSPANTAASCKRLPFYQPALWKHPCLSLVQCQRSGFWTLKGQRTTATVTLPLGPPAARQTAAEFCDHKRAYDTIISSVLWEPFNSSLCT